MILGPFTKIIVTLFLAMLPSAEKQGNQFHRVLSIVPPIGDGKYKHPINLSNNYRL